MQYDKILDIFYGDKNTAGFFIPQSTIQENGLFNELKYLNSPSCLDALRIVETNGQEFCITEYSGFQVLVTKNSYMHMRIDNTDNTKNEFIQKIFDPTSKTITSYRISKLHNDEDENVDLVSINVEQNILCENGRFETCTFDIVLQPKPNFWQDLNKLRVFSNEEFIDFCIKNSTPTTNKFLESFFSVSSGYEGVTLSEDRYTHHAQYEKFKSPNFVNPEANLRHTEVKFDIKDYNLRQQIEWFENNHKNKFINSEFAVIYNMFKTLSPHLRQINHQQSQHPLLGGDNIGALMSNVNVVSVRETNNTL
jgi:hypothetical protein